MNPGFLGRNTHTLNHAAPPDAPRVNALAKIPTQVLEFAILSLISSVAFYFFQFPFSLFCFLTVLLVSILWVLSMSEGWLERKSEVRLALTPYLLLPAAVLLLAFASLVGFEGWAAAPIGVLVTYFVPGSAILFLLGEWKGGGGFSFIGMACALSVVANGLIYFILTTISAPVGSYSEVFLGTYLALSLLPVARKAMTSSLGGGSSLSIDLPELIILSGYAAVVAGALLILYPFYALLPSADITTHFVVAHLASVFPTSLRSLYPFSDFSQAVAILLSRPPAGVDLLLTFNPALQATLAFAGAVVLMLTFYSLAKSFLKGLGPRMPLVATGIFMFFGGLAWTQVQNTAFSQPFSGAALYRLFTASYWDAQAGPGQALWFWFRPITLGVLFLMLLLSLLATRHEDPRRAMVLSALLATGLYFVHVPELMVFVALLFVLAVLKPASMPGLGQVAAGLFVSCPIVALLALEQMHLGILSIGYKILGLFLIGSISTCAVARFVPRPRIHVGSGIVRIVGFLSLVGYVSLALTWLLSPLSFNSNSVSALQIVPTELYPVLLGIGGLLALLALVFYDDFRSRPLLASICMLVVFFIIGRSLSLLNVYAFDTGYWERRIIPILAVPLSILASFGLIRVCSIIQRRTSSVVMVATLGLVVVLGTSSMLLGVTWGTVVYSPALLGPSDAPTASYLASNVTANHIVFPSASETSLATYASGAHVAGTGSLLNFEEEYPEAPLIAMVDTGQGSSYVLANASETGGPGTGNGSDYVLSHLLGVLPVQYASGTTTLYSLGNISAPSLTSSTCIDVARSPGAEELFAYDMLSVLRANYTSVLETDASLSRCSSIFLGANINDSAGEQLLLSSKSASITVLGGLSNEYFSRIFLQAAGGQQMIVDEVSGPGGTFALPTPLSISPARPAPGVTVTSEYIGGSNVSVPLSLQTLVGNHKVTFVNIEPFLETPRAAYSCFPVVAKAVGIHPKQILSNPSIFSSPTVAFTSALLEGTTTFRTSSVAINSTYAGFNVQLYRPGRGEISTKVTSISIMSSTKAMTVSTIYPSITGGAGFYANASVSKSFTVDGSNLGVRLTLMNGTTEVLGSVQDIGILSPSSKGEFELMVRDPTVTVVNGTVVLSNLTPISGDVRASPKATFAGNVSFTLPLNDHYSYLTGLRYSAGVSYSKRLVAWNEAGPLLSISPELAAGGLLLVWWYRFRRPPRGEAAERPAAQAGADGPPRG